MKNTNQIEISKSTKIVLPEIKYGPIKYDIGQAYILLRPAQQLTIQEEGEIKVSPRFKLRFALLSNGEKIIISKRKKVELPDECDGILQETSSGNYTWVNHKSIIEFHKKISSHSISDISSEIKKDWKDQLVYRGENKPVGSPEDFGLRPPQLGALHAVGSHWSLSEKPATIVMPTGTGKTETMLAILSAYQINNIVVAVPSKALRSQIADKFINFGKLIELGVLPGEIKYPLVGIINRRPKSESELQIFKDCNVVVGVVSSLAGGTASDHLEQIANIAGALIVDEAHHVAAKTWNNLKAAFSKKPVLQFTATPFRNDGKLVDGVVIYSYPLKKAQENEYFKNIDFIPVYEPDIENADEVIAEEAIKRLKEDIKQGRPHQMMARCRSKERAEEIIHIYKQKVPELNPILVHSEINDNDERISKIRSGEAKIVVCVNMLGEGVDIPSLKVAAIHDMHQSLAVLLQFIGRFTRNGDSRLGDASAIANIAHPHISNALQQLYSEDADWNLLLREMSSSAAKEHAEFINFLEQSTPYEIDESDKVGISQNSIRPIFSTLFYECSAFKPKNFIKGLSDKNELIKVWINEASNTVYFVTRLKEKVKWSKTKEIEHVEWHLYLLHFDPSLKLLFLASTNKSSNHEGLAKSVGATKQLSGETMFRSLGKIGRLVFNNLGVTKHGRRNLSFAMYTGADVKQALSETEKKGSRKSNISGYGWEDGRQITIGCSYKGRVWSKASGTVPQFIKWAEGVGKKLMDESINTKSVIANVLIPEYAHELPEFEVLSIDWPVELLSQPEERVSIINSGNEFDLFLLDIICTKVDRTTNTIDFEIVTGEDSELICQFQLIVKGEEGFDIINTGSSTPIIKIGTSEGSLVDFFLDYPPLIRFVDLSELDGNIILRSEDSGIISISSERLEAWDWSSVDIKKESIWKKGNKRTDSIQWHVANHFIDGGFSVVYDDDDTGEAADLICFKEEEDFIRLALVHCKFSGAAKEGQRIKDVVEVSSQAIRSARWPGKLKELVKHIQNRERRHSDKPDRTGYIEGSLPTLNSILRSSRFKEVRPEILIVQPGISKNKITDEQSMVLGAAVAYLKQTLAVDLDIICSS